MPTAAPLDLRRHCRDLSEKEAGEVVGILADLIVTYLKKRSGCSNRGSDAVGARRPQEGSNP